MEASAEERLSAAARTITKLNESLRVKDEQLRVLQRAASESQRIAAEASEAADKLRSELEAEKKVTSSAEAGVTEKLAMLELKIKLEKEKAAGAELAHQAAVASAAKELAASKAEVAAERERCAQLQTAVEQLTRAGEEATELWARLKEALLASLQKPITSLLPHSLGHAG